MADGGASAGSTSVHLKPDDGSTYGTTGTVTLRARSPIPALMAMRDAHGERLYTAYGFKDAFNPSYIFADAGSTNRRSATTG